MRDSDTGKFEVVHGMTDTPEYRVWANMLHRCNCETSIGYANYGGRGISVCEEWHSFERFIADMGERPSPCMSIDRIDVNGGYNKENCRWATKSEQARNRRNSRYVLLDGERIPVDEYCERFNISKAAIKNRFRRGWSNSRIINTPVRG